MKFLSEMLEHLQPTTLPDVFTIKHPSVSTIRRRIYVDLCKVTTRSNKRARKNKKRYDKGESKKRITDASKHKKILTDQKLVYPNIQVQRVLEEWNKLKFPFTKHILRKSRTTAQIFHLLIPICKNYETQQIVRAFKVGHQLFNDRSFVFYWMYAKSNHMGLHTFIKLSAKQEKVYLNWKPTKQVEKKYGITIPISWFDECLKGWHYVEKAYCRSFALKDNNPEITEQAIKMMQRHLGRQLNDKGRQDCVKFSKMLVNFANLNKLDYLALFDRISDALNSFHTIKVSKVYYLTTNIFWADTLPAELIRFNKNKYEDMNFISDKELLIK